MLDEPNKYIKLFYNHKYYSILSKIVCSNTVRDNKIYSNISDWWKVNSLQYDMDSDAIPGDTPKGYYYFVVKLLDKHYFSNRNKYDRRK